MTHDELGTSPVATPRRRVLQAGSALAAGAGLGTLTPTPARAVAARRTTTTYGASRVALGRTTAAGIRAVEIELDLRGTQAAGAWTSPVLRTDDFALLGLSWPAHAPTPTVSVRYRSGGAWQGWRVLPILDDRPDPDDESTLRHATQPLWVGSADGVQARVTGHRPATILLSLIRPEGAAADAALASPAPLGRSTTAPAEPGVVPRPSILLRSDWSADESWRDGRPSYLDTIQQVHVHHTVTGNDYSRAETAGLIRGMYYYHTHTLGWSDLGYNFLVDRFGRIWEGRAGGVAKAVRGAHTLGFNATSCGVSIIGNLEEVQPTAATISAIARVAAWKLDLYGRDPAGTTRVLSEGSDKFSRNRAVTLPVIDGHRDTNDTACPGRYLYARLDDIRAETKALVDAAGVTTVTITTAFTVTGDATPGSTLTVGGGAFTPSTATAAYVWLRDGVPIRRATKPVRRVAAADAGHVLSARVSLTAEGHEPATQEVAATEPVRYRPTLQVSATGAGDQLTVGVVVAIDGFEAVTDPGGTMSIRVPTTTDADDVQVVAVVDGRASATFTVPTGLHTVEVGYSGSATVRESAGSTTYRRRRTRRGRRNRR